MAIKLKPLNQQVVVIMGASSGIGRLAGLRFADHGAKVVVSARSESGLRSLVDEIRQRGGDATYKVADTSDYKQVEAVAKHAGRTYGRIDTWVHAAAVAVYATFEQTTPEEFEQVIKVNLLGQVYGAKAALPYLKRNGGALIHIESVEALRAFPFHSAYGASKHGVDGFVEAMRSEFEHEKLPISVTSIYPPGINTPLFNKARTKLGVKPMPAPPIYKPDVVVDAILHAATHPVKRMPIAGMGKGLAMSQRLSPSMTDAVIQGMGFSSQKTNEPKSEHAPDNLFGPIEGQNRIEGDFSNQAIGKRSAPGGSDGDGRAGLGTALLGAALGGALFYAFKQREEGKQVPFLSNSHSQ
jgi:NAD(P)-dependent dehydrogenase (short-subunit alcohol dehydrogenase family)